MKRNKKLDLKKISTTHSKKDDKVKVTSFTVSPVNPKAGKTVTIKMVIKNVSSRLLACVPWQIVKNKKALDCGVRFNLASGDSFRISTTWQADKGSHFFYADADPGNVLKEPKIKQYNNLPQGKDVKVR